jgi:hypothetical protein
VADDRVSAELAAIRERADALQLPGIGLELIVRMGDAVRDLPRLLAAVEAALKLHRMHHPDADGLRPCPTLAAIERALTGEDGSDAS